MDRLAIPAAILSPGEDRFREFNPAFEALWHESQVPTKPSACFVGQLPELHTFSEAIFSEGAVQTMDLSLSSDGIQRTTCLIQGTQLDEHSQDCLMVILPQPLIDRIAFLNSADLSARSALLEWKRLESLYHQAESLNELVLTAAGDGIFGVDATGNTTFMNPAASSTLGWSEEDLIGKQMHQLIHHHYANGDLYPVANCPIQQTLISGESAKIDNEVFWTKTGRAVPVEYQVTPMLTSAGVDGAVIVFRDISERLQTQQALEQALRKVDMLKQRLELENEYLRNEVREAGNLTRIIGESVSIKRILEQIEIVAPVDANVLVTGESGTGKELVAQAIHDASSRRHGPLIRVNCAAIPKELFESEFFGHIKGAFSGATSNRVGRFELADGGTLFLDEVGEIPIELQGKLLRALQERKFERVGEGVPRETNVRIIAATNRDLRTEVAKGSFREDLFFRLDVFPIHCSPLRERLEDIPLLAAYFMENACRRFNIPQPIIEDHTLRQLQHYSWPGNARELQNVIERGSILAQGGPLRFTEPVGTQRPEKSTSPVNSQPLAVNSLAEIEALERELIERRVAECEGRVSGPFGAAKVLGMKPQTLYSRLKRYQTS
ncbi:MAG TPA: sigma 54-interacting transcriptional regulator [Marinobacterium sp.]|nr:sigma 54-interacting transcriptional regulator [Marinobacterium sp.]